MPDNLVATPTSPNNNLYNGGSEWQNDYGNLPDLQQTFYRNYDAALGRWVGVDPMAEGAGSMTSYQYAGNNPVMLNDPLGNEYGVAQQHNPQQDFQNWLDSNSSFGEDGSYVGPNGGALGGYGSYDNLLFAAKNGDAIATQIYVQTYGQSIYNSGYSSGVSGSLFSQNQLTAMLNGTGTFNFTNNGLYFEYSVQVGIPAANGMDAGGGVVLHSGYLNNLDGSSFLLASGSVIGETTPITSITKYYPPNSGFVKPPTFGPLAKGTVLSRMGPPSGYSYSEPGYPATMRSLPSENNLIENIYTVAKDGVEAFVGVAASWFGQLGGAPQINMTQTTTEMLEDGTLINGAGLPIETPEVLPTEIIP